MAFKSLIDTIPDADERHLQDVIDELIEAIETERPDDLEKCYEHLPGHTTKGTGDSRKRRRERKREKEAAAAAAGQAHTPKAAKPPPKSKAYVSETDTESEHGTESVAEDVEQEIFDLSRRSLGKQLEVVINGPNGRGQVGQAYTAEHISIDDDTDAPESEDDDSEGEASEDEDDRRMAARVALLRDA